MKKFINNIKKYYKYAIYAAKADLKAEVANSYLNWLWWVLDPIFFMLIYTFIVEIVFKTSESYFPVFVFVLLTAWDFFNRMVSGSVILVNSKKSIVTKVYIPKYILLIEKSFVYLFKMFISFCLVFILMIVFKVPFSPSVLYVIPITMVLYIISFGFASILLHFGIFVEDLYNVTNIVLKLVFYLSGIFYSIRKRVPSPYYKLLLKGNPIAFIMDQYRVVLIDGVAPSFKWLGIWLAIGIVFCVAGIAIIHKYENSYAKVI